MSLNGIEKSYGWLLYFMGAAAAAAAAVIASESAYLYIVWHIGIYIYRAE